MGIGATGLVAVGDSALFNNIGNNPGFNATGIQNTAVGARSLYSNLGGNSNTAIGHFHWNLVQLALTILL
jgi:hypothetical protein